MELDCYTYTLLLRDAFIDRMSTSEAGRDWLEQAWMLKQTNPDRQTLRSYLGG